MSFNVVFDIDHMLAIPMVKDLPQANFFHQKGAVLSSTTLKTHYVYPGVLELIKLCYSTECIKTSFFSKGGSLRNKSFVKLLLDQALPDPSYDEQIKQTRILSRDDLTKTRDGTKKDLYRVLAPFDSLEDAVLVDDTPRNSMVGQESNFLHVPVVDWEDYDSLAEKVDRYEANGTRYLTCYFNMSGSSDLEDNAVEELRRIFIYKNEEGFEVKFLDKNGNVQIKNVTDHALLSDLNGHYQVGVTNAEQSFLIDDRNTILNICKFVTSCGGRARKICRRANRICYVAGLLFAALSYAQESETTFAYALFTQQFQVKNGCYQNRFQDDRLYLHGLKKLREVNPQFQLVTPANYHFYNNCPISDEDRVFLQNALNNERDPYL